ncbi:MAG: hypothetical protein AAF430_18435 [Myxococcota bacterium]
MEPKFARELGAILVSNRSWTVWVSIAELGSDPCSVLEQDLAQAMGDASAELAFVHFGLVFHSPESVRDA